MKLHYPLPTLLLTLLASQPIMAEKKAPEQKPNVLFILIDDWGWKDVGYNGSKFYETPEIDKLSKEWMRFDTAYAASTMCSPTRLSILTGKSPSRHGVTQWLRGTTRAFVRKNEKPKVFCPVSKSPGIKESEITLGETFQQAGYETAFYGKWHLGPLQATGGPKNHGFDSQKAIIEANKCEMFFPFAGKGYFPDAKKGDNFTDLLTDASIDFIKQKREKPFYLHLCHFAMHAPICSKPEERKRFEEKAAALPKLEKDRKTDAYAHKPQKLRQDSAEYAGELATLDTNIGKIVNALKESGQYENTIIVLTGDNGGRSSYFKAHPTSNLPLKTGKTFLYEGGIRTPLLVHWPYADTKGKQSDTPVTSMDFYPTLLEMAGLEAMPEQHLDGVSLVPLFKGDEFQRPTSLFWHFPHYQGEGSYPGSAIRKGNYKLIKNYHHGDYLLFDLLADPEEENNLATEKPELAKEMHTELMEHLKSSGAIIPKPLKKKKKKK